MAGNNSSRTGGSTKNGSLVSDFESLFTALAGQSSSLTQLILFVYRMVVSQLGFDPSFFLTMCGCIWAVCKLSSPVFAYCSGLVDRHYTCSIVVSEFDPIHRHLMRWLSQQQRVYEGRHLMAQTVFYEAWETKEDLDADLHCTETGDEDFAPRYLSNNAALSVRFIPAMGTTSCWHNGKKFLVCREKESVIATLGLSPVKEVEDVKISYYGRSIKPIKDLLADASTLYHKATQDMTKIYCPLPKEHRRGRLHPWQEAAKRPKRPMKTVVLEETEKKKILRDVNKYLNTRTARWYASRGIPLRRGYLLHGPPGTGKTSFSLALAGHFGLDIYVISLMDADLTEGDLSALFSKLPRRCIVLLEDVDTAGLRRDEEQDEEANQEESAAGRTKKNAKNISLSGLLNVLDGVISHEGHLLIMTTNKPESLDEALIRPGRIDFQVPFKNASQKQAEDLFYSMYGPTQQIKVQEVKEAVNKKNDKLGNDPTPQGQLINNAKDKKNDEVVNTSPPQVRDDKKAGNERTDKLANISAPQVRKSDMTVEAIKKLSADFGKMFPDDQISPAKISPAEIQGYLLNRKDEPLEAFEGAEDWIKGLIKQKESNSNVETVQ